MTVPVTIRSLTEIADGHSLFADCTSTLHLQRPARFSRNGSNKLFIAAAPSISAEPCIFSPGCTYGRLVREAGRTYALSVPPWLLRRIQASS